MLITEIKAATRYRCSCRSSLLQVAFEGLEDVSGAGREPFGVDGSCSLVELEQMWDNTVKNAPV